MKNTYETWLNANLPIDLQEELISIKHNPEEINDRFYQYIKFGTAGMRGLLGAGTNRMNILTVRRVAWGFAQYVSSNGEEARERGVVIAYDTRHYSRAFAEETARVLGANGIKSYVFTESRPTPELSFAIRELHAYAGVMITASHNPKEYNGYKVYGEDGAQLTPEYANAIVQYMDQIEDIFAIEAPDLEVLDKNGLVEELLDDIDTTYIEKLKSISERADVKRDYSIVYTPLHGAGFVPVMQGLKAAGFNNVYVVKEQALEDGDFPTVQYPNPEESAAFEMAIELGNQVGAGLLLATDPDSDRLGVAVKNNDRYQLLTGNQVGALVTDYLVKAKKEFGTLSDDAVLIKTIVTSELGPKIARNYNVKTLNTLTGFKYIAEKIEEFERTASHTYLFGYEESYGYLVKSFVRDKDAVQMALLVAEIAGYYELKGQTLLDGLEELYKMYGYHRETLVSQTYEGQSGSVKMMVMLERLRENLPTAIGNVRVICVEDYLSGQATFTDGQVKELALPKENVLKFLLEDESWIAIRPSGTEPKCKYYFGVVGVSASHAESKLEALKESFLQAKH